jgi:hypothetical protein
VNKNIIFVPALFCLLLVYLYGCTAPLVVQGLSSAAPVAFHTTGKGKGNSAWLAHYDDVVQATLEAGKTLSFKLEEKTIGKDQSAFNYSDDMGSELDILIERRTNTVTLVQFNVGMHGPISIGRLMARQIITEMEKAGKFLGDWQSEESN